MKQADLQRKREHGRQKVKAVSTAREGVRCPNCGTTNDTGAVFCENCGHAIGQNLCPYCQAPLSAGTDICESCHHYVLKNICSFCGSSIGPLDYFCPECGISREGLLCPVCHTHNIYSICTNCGTPLTDSARKEQSEVRLSVEYAEMRRMSKELNRLQHYIVATTEEQLKRKQKGEDIRSRVLNLLKDEGLFYPQRDQFDQIQTEEELEQLIEKKRIELQNLLNNMAAKKQTSAALTRRYVLARKPPLSNLGWRCNYKNELHHGPQECACPQMGGTWVVLEGKLETELKSNNR